MASAASTSRKAGPDFGGMVPESGVESTDAVDSMLQDSRGHARPVATEKEVDEVSEQRFNVKLHLLGGSAGFFLLLLILGVGGLLLLLNPPPDRILFWVVPLGTSVAVLIGVFATRRRQYDDPSLVWYMVLSIALLLTGVGLAAFLMEALAATEPLRQVAALLLLSMLIFMGAMLFAVDFMLVGLYLLGLGLSAFFYLLNDDVRIAPDLLSVLLVSIVAIPLLSLWAYRMQRNLVRSVGELVSMRPKFIDAREQVVQLRNSLESQGSRQQEVSKELRRAMEAAEAAGFAKTEFLATMSHEIRTPLNGIVPILEILRETPLDSEQAEFVTTALNSSHHLLNLINDILDYSKIEAGKLELETIEVNISELIESIISLMTKAAERRGLRLQSKIARNVPQQVRGDPFRLRQILTNLVSNAIKFTDRGSISVEVNRHASSPKEVVLLFAVRDTGIGMSKKAVGQLFQVFSQADASTTRKYGGTGLGLMICRRLVELMGGRIGVKSEEGKGSVFWFVAPMRRATHEVPFARKSLQGVRVLLAGLDELEQQRIVSYLNDWDMLNETTGSSMDALTKLKASARLGASWSYDVLLVDAQTMGSGLGEMMRSIRKIFELSTLLVIAVDTFPSMAQIVKDAGIAEIIPRPVQEQELRGRLHRLLDVQTSRNPKAVDQEGRAVVMPDAQFSWEDGRGPRDQMQNRAGNTPFSASSQSQNLRSVLSDGEPLVGRILVVEDNPVNLSVVRKLLQRLGLTCEASRDGLEALEAINNTQFDLILMDVQMPNMDGYQATGAIRRREAKKGLAHLPIVAMTANAMAGDREKCLNAGMDDYMSKPVKPADLKNMLRQWLPMQEVINKAPAVQSTQGQGSLTQQTESLQEPGIPLPVDDGPVKAERVLDLSVLEELFEIMEGEAVALLQEYLDNAPDLLKDVERAVTEGNADALVLPAHSLKSSSANVGGLQVSAVAKQLEFMGRDDEMGGAAQAWKEMQAAYAAAGRELREIIQRGGL